MPTEQSARSLKALQDVVAAQPSLKKPLVYLQLQHLERERLLSESVQDVVRVEIFSGIRSVLSTAVGLIFLVLIYSKLVVLANWMENARTITVPLPPPINRSVALDLSGYIPSSTSIGWVAKLPAIDWQTAWKWVMVIIFVIAVEKFVSEYQTWRRAQTLRATTEAIQDEIRSLRAWMERDK